MSELKQNPFQPGQGFEKVSLIYEHLYPDRKWSDLRRLHPRNIPYLLNKLFAFPDDAEVFRKVSKAYENKQGITLPYRFFPDKWSSYFRLSGMRRVEKEIPRGKIVEVLHENEDVGGVVISGAPSLKEVFNRIMKDGSYNMLNDPVNVIGLLKD